MHTGCARVCVCVHEFVCAAELKHKSRKREGGREPVRLTRTTPDTSKGCERDCVFLPVCVRCQNKH